MLASKGASGVVGAALVMLVSALSVVPVVGMVLIFGIHRFLSTGLAMTNLVGNGVAAIVVCAGEEAGPGEVEGASGALSAFKKVRFFKAIRFRLQKTHLG